MSERPVSRAGISFDISLDDKNKSCKKQPPSRLSKLEKQKTKPASQKDINKKLELAQMRREKHEQEKLDKIQVVTKARD